MIAALGARDLVIVHTSDATWSVPGPRAGGRELVARLKKEPGADEFL